MLVHEPCSEQNSTKLALREFFIVSSSVASLTSNMLVLLRACFVTSMCRVPYPPYSYLQSNQVLYCLLPYAHTAQRSDCPISMARDLIFGPSFRRHFHLSLHEFDQVTFSDLA